MSKKKTKYIPDITRVYTPSNIKYPTKYFNRTLGIKLNTKLRYKNKDIKSLETRIHNTLMGINCVVCGVPIKVKKVTKKKPIKHISNFIKRCNLDFNRRHNEHTLMFRKKTIALTTSMIISDESKIFKRLSKPYKHNDKYNTFRMVKDHEFFNAYMKFVLNMISYDNMYAVTESLLDMYYVLNKKDISKTISKYRRLIYKDLQKDDKHIFGKKSKKLLCDIFNMSAILCTGNNKCDVFKYKKFKGCSMYDDLGNMIYKLGKIIIKYGASKPYTVYIQCNPKIRTMYFKEVREKDAMAIGVMALAYFGYIFNTPDIHYIVRNLLRRPQVSDQKY